MTVPSKGKGLLLVTSSHHGDGLVRLPLGGLTPLQLLLSLCSSPEGSYDIEKTQGRKQRDARMHGRGPLSVLGELTQTSPLVSLQLRLKSEMG